MAILVGEGVLACCAVRTRISASSTLNADHHSEHLKIRSWHASDAMLVLDFAEAAPVD